MYLLIINHYSAFLIKKELSKNYTIMILENYPIRWVPDAITFFTSDYFSTLVERHGALIIFTIKLIYYYIFTKENIHLINIVFERRLKKLNYLHFIYIKFYSNYFSTLIKL